MHYSNPAITGGQKHTHTHYLRLAIRPRSGPDKGITIIWIFYLSPLSILIPCFMAMNSAPKTEVSIVPCCFNNQIIGAKMINQYGSIGFFSRPHGHCLPSYEGQRLCQGEKACREELLLPHRHRTLSIQKMGRQFGQCQGMSGQR
jgi:hypothetical protein